MNAPLGQSEIIYLFSFRLNLMGRVLIASGDGNIIHSLQEDIHRFESYVIKKWMEIKDVESECGEAFLDSDR
jgi:hypothetical protein